MHGTVLTDWEMDDHSSVAGATSDLDSGTLRWYERLFQEHAVDSPRASRMLYAIRPWSRRALVNQRDDLQEAFEQLRETWSLETAPLSSPKEIALHDAYQRIIGLGPSVIPLILRQLQQEVDHWFWALRALTGADPAVGINSMDRAAEAWLRWGVEEGYIEGEVSSLGLASD